ncbi:hypothetical protein [Streptomyces sp. NPDC058157]|uniref:hypothetical protein n=1 Tax=Streptomyces sp. NPDC058157 TaxID=3346360 RepID=UPI0036E5D2EA
MTEPQTHTEAQTGPQTEPQAATPAEPQTGAQAESQAESQTESQAATPVEPQAEGQAGIAEAPAPVGPAPAVNRRKRVAVIALAAVAALLAGGGVWAASALADADRTAPTAYWVEAGGKLPSAQNAAPVPANELTGKLLPLPSGFEPGPDLGGDGHDFYASGEKAAEAFTEARKGLSDTERKKRDDMLADLKLKGLAARTYAATGGSMVVEIRLMQADPKAVGAFSEVSKKLLDLTGDDRDAPKVDGYPDAKCSLLAVGERNKEKLDSLYCVAVQGDVLVSLRAYGPKDQGLSKLEATGFLKNQLSRLKSPGESV